MPTHIYVFIFSMMLFTLAVIYDRNRGKPTVVGVGHLSPRQKAFQPNYLVNINITIYND